MAKIVIVDDDGALRNDIADMLSDCGHKVFQAADGRQGFAVIEKFRPDLVLSDIKMPHESGFDLVKRVTEGGAKYANMPFLFMSAIATPDAARYGRQCGADDFIAKPIDYRVLKKKIDSSLRRKNSVGARFLSFFGFRAGLSTTSTQ